MKKSLLFLLLIIYTNIVLSQIANNDVNKHTILINTTQIFINEYNIIYKYNANEKFSFIAEIGYKKKGDDTLYYPDSYLQFIPFSAASTIGNVDTRFNFALLAERKKRLLDITYGLYYRYRKIDKIYYNNFAGTYSDSWGTYRTETAHMLGIVFQLSKEISIKFKDSNRIIIEPYLRELLLLPLKVNGESYAYYVGSSWVYTDPIEISNKCKGIGPFLITGINIGYSF
jgi:hypothetical protein